jgi:hypothetical protein
MAFRLAREPVGCIDRVQERARPTGKVPRRTRRPVRQSDGCRAATRTRSLRMRMRRANHNVGLVANRERKELVWVRTKATPAIWSAARLVDEIDREAPSSRTEEERAHAWSRLHSHGVGDACALLGVSVHVLRGSHSTHVYWSRQDRQHRGLHQRERGACVHELQHSERTHALRWSVHGSHRIQEGRESSRFTMLACQ